jgi:hypothetical protein
MEVAMEIRKQFVLAAGLALAAGAGWCGSASAAGAEDHAAADTSRPQAGSEAARVEFAARLGRELDTLGDRIVVLKDKAKAGGAKVKQETRDEIKRLEAARERAAARVDSLAKAGEGRWDVAREKTSREVDSLKAALDRLWKKVKS